MPLNTRARQTGSQAAEVARNWRSRVRIGSRLETLLKGGSAMIDDVPFGRVSPLRQRVTRQIKAAIGGTVTTSLISPTTNIVDSALVIDAKTEDQQHRELDDAMLRLWAGEVGLPLGQPDWRHRWSQVATPPGQYPQLP